MTRIARTALSMLATVALITPGIATAQAAGATAHSYETAKGCLTAAGVYYIFSDDASAEQSDAYARQVDFWLGEFRAADGNHEADLDAMMDADYARLQELEGGKPATEILAQFADTFNACSDKWGGQVARKIESPDPVKNFTMEESQTCLFSTIAVMLVAARDPNADLDALELSGEFWANEADKYGDLPEDELAALNARADDMIAASLDATTPEQTAAFLAPYEADFAACEAKMSAVKGAKEASQLTVEK